MIQFGSTSLTEAQSRYSITEIELLAMVWGMQKAAFYTKGAPNVVVYNDHSGLTSLHTKELIKIDNQRLVNMLERLVYYNYSVKHLASTKNATLDYLLLHTATAGQARSSAKAEYPQRYGQ